MDSVGDWTAATNPAGRTASTKIVRTVTDALI